MWLRARWMGRERIKPHFKSREGRGERMHPQGTSDAGIVADEPSPDENATADPLKQRPQAP
jgi:hypothetical protein